MDLIENINGYLNKLSNFYKLKNQIKKDLIKDLYNKLKEDLKDIPDIKKIICSKKRIFILLNNNLLNNNFNSIMVDFGLLDEKTEIEIKLVEDTLKLENITIKNTRGFEYEDILTSIQNIIKIYNVLLQHKEA